MEVIFERPSKDDVIKLHNFFDKVIDHTFDANGIGHLDEFIQEEKISKRSALRQDFDSEGNIRLFYVAKIEGNIVGTIEIGPSNEILKKNVPEVCHLKEVGTVYVHPDYQGQGIGKALLGRMNDALYALGEKQYVLDSGYPIAQKVWRKVLGEPYKVLLDYWGEGGHHSIWIVDVTAK